MQDKRNFQGGLNRDDDPRVSPDGDYLYAQNIRVLSSEDNSTMLVENIRGMLKETNPRTFASKEGVFGEPGEYKVIGSYEDKPTNCIYYFVFHRGYFHQILEYNINTDVISTVYRDNGHSDDNVLRFDINTLITGINKIDDLLYWTSDNEYTSDTGEVIHNEPKFINVEMAKAGWTVYYDSGNYTTNPQSTGEGSAFTYDIKTMYPFEFYTSSLEGSPNDDVSAWRKRKYIDVCKHRPHPPIYFHQTPIKNIGSITIDFSDTSTFTMSGTETAILAVNPDTGEIDVNPDDLASGAIMYGNIPLETINKVAELDFAYKKNNLYGFMWQFAYRYVYINNEVGSYSEWSYVLPAPQYGTNMVDEGKQNLYNQIRVWYHNGPSDVKSIEIVARKCSYIETSPDEGNKGEFYLIATVDNNYYDSTYSSAGTDYTPVAPIQYGWTEISTRNIPFVALMSSSGDDVSHSGTSSGFIDFRNDGVYTQVDPSEFSKLYDQVPKRAKSQEIIAENRLAYGNYIDGFDQVKPHFELLPEYGNPVQFTVLNPTSNGVIEYDFGGGGFTSEQISEYNLNEENFGAEVELNLVIWPLDYVDGYPGVSTVEAWAAIKGMGWDCNFFQQSAKIVFPTQVQFGQKIRVRFYMIVRFQVDWCDNSNKEVAFPHPSWSSNWSQYKYDNFGVQIDLEKTVGVSGIQGLVTEFKSDIEAMTNFAGAEDPTPFPDTRGLEENDGTDNFNPNYGEPLHHHYREKSGSQSYDYDAELQSGAEMRLVSIEQGDSDFGTNNVLTMVFSPFGMPQADESWQPDMDCSDNEYPLYTYRMADGTETTNIHNWRKTDESGYCDSTECACSTCCGGFQEIGGSNSQGCTDCGGCRFDPDDNFEYPQNGSSAGSGFSYTPGLEQGSVWADEDVTNQPYNTNLLNANDASCFKSGAWHRFGLVYYDGKGRSSSVMLNEPSISNSERTSSVYVGFPTEKKYVQTLADGITSTELSNSQKLEPADIAWKIYHKPPIWSRYYHWVYARNSSVGNFMQFFVEGAFINKAAKVGTSQGEAEADTKIYLSLNTMDGRLWSYSKRNRSLVGEWSFAEGDRIRIITDKTGTVMTDPDNSALQRYYDFKVSEVGHYPGKFDFDPNLTPDSDSVDGISGKTVLSSDSPAGGEQNKPETARLGKFVILDDPKLTGFGINDESDGEITNWSGCMIEIYRPKKNTNDELSLYYEFSERFPIFEAGTDTRHHSGGLGGQVQIADANYVASETVDSDIPATGEFRRGDVWYKARDISTSSVTMPGQFVESYFLNDFMQTNHNNIGRPHVHSPYAVEKRRKATITYSDVYQPDTQYNGFHSFNFSQRPYMDYDLSLGSIQKLISRETNLVMMQENKCSTLMVSKNIINSPAGDAGITLSTNVLPKVADPVTGDYGPCLNPESVAIHDRSIYFVDIKRGTAIRIGGDGLTVISDYKMIDFFRDKMDLYQNILTSEYDNKLDGGLFILGGYDRRHGEYVITFPNVYETDIGTTDRQKSRFGTANVNFETNSLRQDGSTTWNFNTEIVRDNIRGSIYDEDVSESTKDGGRRVKIRNKAETLSFNERANRWSSFYTFYPDYYGTLNRIFISFKNGVLYKHDSDSTSGKIINHCMFYDNPYPEEAQIQFPFNGDVSTVKTWNTLSVEGSDKQEIIPLISTSTDGSDSFVVATTDSPNIVATNINFTANDIEVGDSVWYNDGGTLRTLGVIVNVISGTTIRTSEAEVNAFITASSTSSGNALFDVFILTADTTMYKASLETNINGTELSHRTSYNNTSRIAGTWVTREGVSSTHIPFGNTSSSGGEYFGIGTCISNTSTTALTGVGTAFTTAGVVGALIGGDSIYYDNDGTEVLIGTISSITSDTAIVLSDVSTTTLGSATFMYVKKNAFIEGDRLKGHYMDTKLTKRTKDKVHLYAANANVISSELSNK